MKFEIKITAELLSMIPSRTFTEERQKSESFVLYMVVVLWHSLQAIRNRIVLVNRLSAIKTKQFRDTFGIFMRKKLKYSQKLNGWYKNELVNGIIINVIDMRPKTKC